jgi:hypothetical protein
MLIAFSVLAFCVFGVVSTLWVLSPGAVVPFLDQSGKPREGSISVKLHVNINGVEQGMFITGKDKTNPVLLFLHGGPGMLNLHYLKNTQRFLRTISSCAGGTSVEAGFRSTLTFQ